MLIQKTLRAIARGGGRTGALKAIETILSEGRYTVGKFGDKEK